MRISIVCCLLLGIVMGMNAGNLQAQNRRDVKEADANLLINGYAPSEFYYNNVQIPSDVAASTEKEDRINVALHNKIVTFEKESQQPINSLPKNDLEAMLAQFKVEVEQELGYANPPSAPIEEVPGEKPAIILPEGDQR